MAYIPRFTQNSPVPMYNNPDWYSNNAFYNIPTTPTHAYGLPNCTCFCLGRWIELFRDYGVTEYPNLSLNSAWYWYGHEDDYPRGQTPKLGAIACWENIASGGTPGHVGVVEEIYPDGSYTTSNSNLGAEYFITYHITADNFLGSDFRFQGFIYNPYVDSGSGKHIPLLQKIIKRRLPYGRQLMAPSGIPGRK